MIRKPCSKCGTTDIDKPFKTSFYYRKDGTKVKLRNRISYCKLCVAEQQRDWYYKNKDKRKASNDKWREKNKPKLRASEKKSRLKRKWREFYESQFNS